MRSLAARFIGLFILAAAPMAAQEINHDREVLRTAISQESHEVAEMDGAHPASGGERYSRARPAPRPASTAPYRPFRELAESLCGAGRRYPALAGWPHDAAPA